mgnify:CR=1 FL=1
MSTHFARLRRDAPASAEVIAGHRGLTADALDKQLRGDLDSIVALATAQDPDERYPGAHALAEDLTRWLSGRASSAFWRCSIRSLMSSRTTTVMPEGVRLSCMCIHAPLG